MAVKIIPKPITKLPPWLDILFNISLVLIIISIVSLLMVDHFQKRDSERLLELREAMAAQETPQEKELKERVLNTDKRIKDFALLLQEHRETSNCFDFLQDVSHPKIQFTSFDFTAERFHVRLSGLTESFQTLGQQLIIFREHPEIKNIKLSGISKGKEGQIIFTFDLFLSPQIFSF